MDQTTPIAGAPLAESTVAPVLLSDQNKVSEGPPPSAETSLLVTNEPSAPAPVEAPINGPESLVASTPREGVTTAEQDQSSYSDANAAAVPSGLITPTPQSEVVSAAQTVAAAPENVAIPTPIAPSVSEQPIDLAAPLIPPDQSPPANETVPALSRANASETPPLVDSASDVVAKEPLGGSSATSEAVTIPINTASPAPARKVIVSQTQPPEPLEVQPKAPSIRAVQSYGSLTNPQISPDKLGVALELTIGMETK